jgi:hypothetical protein
MPSMANIVVKKADDTTNITYDVVSASGGDMSPAVWRQDTGAVAGLPVGLRNVFKLSSKWNGPKTARQISFELTMPYAVQDSTTTLYSAKDRVVFNGMMTVPQGIPAANINEAVYQGLNLVGALLTRQAAAAGYAPT